MRTIILTLATLTLMASFPVRIDAQEDPSIILKVGAITSRQDFDYHDSPFSLSDFTTDYRWGIAVGGELRAVTIGRIDIMMELLYVQKGMSITVMETSPQYPEGTGNTVTVHPDVKYLTLSGAAKLRVLSGPLSPFLRLGPRVDMRIDDSFSFDFRPVDLGLTAGIGAELSLGPLPALVLEGRFNPDLTSAYEGQYVTIHNRSFELLAGIGF